MSDADGSEKSEEPTGRKLQKAREKGTVANSKEVTTWMMLFGTAMVIAIASPYTLGQIKDRLSPLIGQVHEVSFYQSDIGAYIFDMIFDIIFIVIWPLLAIIFIAVLGNIFQFGFLVSVESIKPKLSKLSPIAGAKKLVNMKQLVEFVKNILKLVVVGGAGTAVLIPHFGLLQALPGIDIHYFPDEIYFLLLKLFGVVLIILFFIAIADVAFQRYQHIKQLRMTKQEVKEEYKNVEGDPQVKGRMRQIRMQRAAERMMQSVPEADVVVTNPTHFAVALSYDQDSMDAPKVLAKGQDHIAAKIREIAEENDIPLIENPPLARALYATAEINEYIPEEHFQPVAEVISYVYGLRDRGKGTNSKNSSDARL